MKTGLRVVLAGVGVVIVTIAIVAVGLRTQPWLSAGDALAKAGSLAKAGMYQEAFRFAKLAADK